MRRTRTWVEVSPKWVKVNKTRTIVRTWVFEDSGFGIPWALVKMHCRSEVWAVKLNANVGTKPCKVAPRRWYRARCPSETRTPAPKAPEASKAQQRPLAPPQPNQGSRTKRSEEATAQPRNYAHSTCSWANPDPRTTRCCERCAVFLLLRRNHRRSTLRKRLRQRWPRVGIVCASSSAARRRRGPGRRR